MKKKRILLLTVALAVCLSACGDIRRSSGNDTPETGGVDDGRIGDVIHTYFYDFVVSRAVLADEYYGYTPAAGNRLLLVDVTIKNTCNESIVMADFEFQLQWGDGDDDFTIPITTDFDTGEENEAAYVNEDEQFPYEFTLRIDESRWGVFVYEVPSGLVDFCVAAQDSFEGGETGDVYFVYFSADDANAA